MLQPHVNSKDSKVLVISERNTRNWLCRGNHQIGCRHKMWVYQLQVDTVDGRNPAPVDRQFIPLFTGFYTSQVVSRISPINSSTFQLFHLTLPEPNGSLESHVFKWIQATSTYSRASTMMSCKMFL